jgi:PelA/Pel-15E family pectate lyase
MQIKDPSPRIVASVHSGVAWLKAAALHDVAWVKTSDDRVLQAQPGARLLWSRYYDLKTGKPIFGDRDKTIHDTVTEISQERRLGYSWYNTTPQKALDAYAKWSQTHPQ